MTRLVTALFLIVGSALMQGAAAQETVVKALNRSGGEFFVFAPDVVRIASGGMVNFVAADIGHEVHSVPGMIPEGAEPFELKMNQSAKVVFTVPGIYVIACRPHMAMGMVGLVVVGDSVNLNKIDPNSLPGKGKAKLATLLQSLKRD
jgi:pseudoazurin